MQGYPQRMKQRWRPGALKPKHAWGGGRLAPPLDFWLIVWLFISRNLKDYLVNSFMHKGDTKPEYVKKI